MNYLLYYWDKYTAWLDFSWFITRPQKKIGDNNNTEEQEEPPVYTPLLDEPININNDSLKYNDPLLRL